MKSPEPLSTAAEKQTLAEADKQLKDLSDPFGSSNKNQDISNASDDYEDGFDDDIQEDLPVEEPELNLDEPEGQSQSMGMDPSVTSLDIEGYDYVEEVQK